jgi:hypothetical protein
MMNKILTYFKNKFFSEKVHADFLLLFAQKEGKELLGNRFRNFWFLSGILFLTFLTIGFANGSLDYLEKKMSDPFVNWVSIAVPYGRNTDIPDVRKDLLKDENVEKFGVKTISGYFGLILQFKNYKTNNTFIANGRSIAHDSPLLSHVFGKNNFLKGKVHFEENSPGIIVTKGLLEKLSYDGRNPFINMAFSIDEDSSLQVALPIISIVEEMPGLYEFAFTPFFFDQRISTSHASPFRIDRQNDGSLNIFLSGHNISEVVADSLLKEFFTHNDYSNLMPMTTLTKDTLKIVPGLSANISFYPYPDETELTLIFESINQSPLFQSYSIYRQYAFKFNHIPVNEEFHYLSIHFEELNKIRNFRSYLVENHNLDIDMSLIESKENYSFISRLTRILSVILLAFSVLSLTIYTSNVFIRHIEKIKMNLGTFKAFGLDNRLLKRIYLSLILLFVFGGILFGMASATLVGKIGFIPLILKLLNYSLDLNYNFFSLNSIWTIFVVLIILFTLVVTLIFVTNKLLKKSPGDLIYNR